MNRNVQSFLDDMQNWELELWNVSFFQCLLSSVLNWRQECNFWFESNLNCTIVQSYNSATGKSTFWSSFNQLQHSSAILTQEINMLWLVERWLRKQISEAPFEHKKSYINVRQANKNTVMAFQSVQRIIVRLIISYPNQYSNPE